MKRFQNILKLFNTISIIKTLYFNFKAFDISTALRLPVLVGKKVSLRNIGKVILSNKFSKKIHIGSSNLFNTSSSMPTVWNNLGTVVFNGPVIFYPSSTIYVGRKGIIEFDGDNKIGKDSSILCVKKIRIGKNSELSWNCQISDSDFHFMQNIESNEIKPRAKEISIGANVWCGNHVIIGKGVSIAEYCICAMNTMINKDCKTPNSLLAGIPARIINGKYRRIFDLDEEMALSQQFE